MKLGGEGIFVLTGIILFISFLFDVAAPVISTSRKECSLRVH